MVIRTLQLVTSRQPFFENQIRSLEQKNVRCDIISVPSPSSKKRSVKQYVKFYSQVLPQSFKKYDIIHANYGLMAPFALAQPRRPVVLTLWGSDLMGTFQGLSQRLSFYFDAVVLPSSAMATNCPVDYFEIPFGIRTDVFRPMSQTRCREELGWDLEEKIVLFPYSEENEIKNHHLAEKVVEGVSVSARLKCISDVPHERVPIYMNASDAVLVTSKRESGPMVVKEAVLCDVPVVTTNVGFVEQVLKPVENAFIADRESELITYLETVLSKDVNINGQKMSSEWGLERMGERLISLYNQLLQQEASSSKLGSES